MKWHIPHRLPKYGQSKKWRQNDSLGQEYWSHCQLFPTKVFRVFSKSRENISCDKQRVGKPGGISAALPLAFCLSSTNLVKYWWRADLAAKRRDQVSNKYLQKKPPMGEKAWGRKSSPWKKPPVEGFIDANCEEINFSAFPESLDQDKTILIYNVLGHQQLFDKIGLTQPSAAGLSCRWPN